MDELELAGEFDELELQTKGKEKWESEDEDEGGAAKSECSEPGDLTCAICLGNIPLEELAMVKGCDHMYCVKCILAWALHKEEPWCPQCKAPFSYLLTYRTLDGSLQDFPCEESVCLLKRARWFEDHMRATEKGKALLEESRLQDETAWQDWADDYELASDEEMEAFYFSSAAGRARVVIGNRRFGEGGYVSGGRRQARAVNPAPRGKHNSGKGGKTGEHAVLGTPPLPAARTPNAGGGRRLDAPPAAASGDCGGPSSRSISVPGSNGTAAAAASAAAGSPIPCGASPSSSRGIYGSSPSPGNGIYGSSPGSGRRARRNARRAAHDYADAYAY